jgi:hypothetical protein
MPASSGGRSAVCLKPIIGGAQLRFHKGNLSAPLPPFYIGMLA